MTQEEMKQMVSIITAQPKWHVEETDSIVMAVNSWSTHNFLCVMKDSTLCFFKGFNCETYEGSINTYVEDVDDKYSLDDIVLWTEY